jgi:hypothetical protein
LIRRLARTNSVCRGNLCLVIGIRKYIVIRTDNVLAHRLGLKLDITDTKLEHEWTPSLVSIQRCEG